MKADKVAITDKLVKSLSPPEKGNHVTYDSDIKGFGVRITHKGARAFVLNYYADRRERRLTIGRYPEWTVVAARDEAKRLKRIINRGGDPLAQRIADRDAPTIHDLWLAYSEKHLPTKRDRPAKDDASMWRTYILPAFGRMKLADLTAADVDRLHAQISREKPIRANRVIEVLRKAINLAIRWKWVSENPCVGVKKNTETPRHRYAGPEELSRLASELAKHPNQDSCDAIRMMMLTGARKGEVLKARWGDINLAERVWTKPSAHTKQNRTHRVPLGGGVGELLLRRREYAECDAVWVFPGDKPGHHLTDIKRTWQSVRADAGLDDLTLHDLRRTFASILASSGYPLHLVGALLGHTQQQTTLRYAYLFDDPMREGVNTVSDVFQQLKAEKLK